MADFSSVTSDDLLNLVSDTPSGGGVYHVSLSVGSHLLALKLAERVQVIAASAAPREIAFNDSTIVPRLRGDRRFLAIETKEQD